MSRFACLALLLATTQAADLVVIGDSWGTYGATSFRNMVQRHGSNMSIDNVAISGTTAVGWVNNHMNRLINAVRPADTKAVWLVAGGNDAQFFIPGCSASGKSRAECIEELRQTMLPALNTLVQAIVDNCGNSSVEVIAFGYDIMSFSRDAGLVCAGLPLVMFPSCGGDNTCFNSEFLNIQAWFETLPASHSSLTVLNLLGALQANQGYNATLGHPDLDRYSPNNLYGDCIHPNNAGFDVLFDHMWNMFFSKYA